MRLSGFQYPFRAFTSGIHLQQRGVVLANGVADIVWTRAFRVYVSNFSPRPSARRQGHEHRHPQLAIN